MKKLTKTTLLLAFVFALTLSACQEEVVPQLENSETNLSEVIDSSGSETNEEEENEGSDIRK